MSGIFAATAPKTATPLSYPDSSLPPTSRRSCRAPDNGAPSASHASTGEAAPVDPRHGIPVIRRAGQPYKFLDPTEAYRDNPLTEYGLMMATSSSRILFPKPTVNPAEPNVLRTSPPAMADPLRWPNPREPSRVPPTPCEARNCRSSTSPQPTIGSSTTRSST